MLRILAGVSILLLTYEAYTLGTSVVVPLLRNANILQTDFHYYYEAALRFRADPSRLYLPTDDVIAGFAYPPPAIVPFMVLSHLPLGLAFLIFTTCSYAAVLAAIWAWIRYLRDRGAEVDPEAWVALSIIAVALGPTYMNAIFGQVNTFVLGCGVAFVSMSAVRPWASGSWLAAGMWLKIYPVLNGAAALWDHRSRKAIVYGAIAALLMALVLLPIVPSQTYRSFVDVLQTRLDKTAVHISNQSLIAFMERFSIAPERFLNWSGEQALNANIAVRASNAFIGLGLIALLWTRARSNPQAMATSTAALIALAAVIAPLGWGHTYVLVLPLVVTQLLSMRHDSILRTTVVCACVTAMMLPATRRFGFLDTWPAPLQNIAYSRYLLATLVLIALPAPRGQRPLTAPPDSRG